jgi:hypothetical protein
VRHEPTISGQSLGYVSSGRMAADMKREEAIFERGIAHRYFRLSMPNTAKQHMRRAIRAWRFYSELRQRIVQ